MTYRPNVFGGTLNPTPLLPFIMTLGSCLSGQFFHTLRELDQVPKHLRNLPKQYFLQVGCLSRCPTTMRCSYESFAWSHRRQYNMNVYIGVKTNQCTLHCITESSSFCGYITSSIEDTINVVDQQRLTVYPRKPFQ